MKYTVRVEDAPGVGYAGNEPKCILLFDENGNQFPNVFAGKVEYEVDSLPRMTISFWIDGKRIAFAK